MSHVPDITGALNEVIGKGDPFQGGPGEDIDEVFKGDETPFSRSFYAEQAAEARARETHRREERPMRCAHGHCRTSLTEETAVFCPHGLPFCEHCTWEEACDDCNLEAVSA